MASSYPIYIRHFATHEEAFFLLVYMYLYVKQILQDSVLEKKNINDDFFVVNDT